MNVRLRVSGVECEKTYGSNLIESVAASGLHCEIVATDYNSTIKIVNGLVQLFAVFPERFSKCCIARLLLA